jgi:hypothetical protein
MMKKLIFAAGILFSVATLSLKAQADITSNTGKKINQHAEIRKEVRNKELTRSGKINLRREQKKIDIEKRLAEVDGVVTPAEKRFLKREKRRESKRMTEPKSDSDTR